MPAKRKKTGENKTPKKKSSAKKSTVKKRKTTKPGRKAKTAAKPKASKKKLPGVSKEIKQDIKKSIDNLPGIIYEQVKKEKEFESYAKRKKIDIASAKPRGHILLWFGVLGLTAVIFFMWILNTKTTLTAIKSRPSNERHLYENAKEDLRDIMNSFAGGEKDEITPELQENTEADVKKLLSDILSSVTLKTFSTTTTSTILTSTTTLSSTTTIDNTDTATTSRANTETVSTTATSTETFEPVTELKLF